MPSSKTTMKKLLLIASLVLLGAFPGYFPDGIQVSSISFGGLTGWATTGIPTATNIGGCGTNPAIAGNSTTFRLTVGTSTTNTDCLITFPSAAPRKWACNFQENAYGNGAVAIKMTAQTTTSISIRTGNILGQMTALQAGVEVWGVCHAL